MTIELRYIFKYLYLKINLVLFKAVTNLGFMEINVTSHVPPIVGITRVTSRTEHVMYVNLDGLGQRVIQVILGYNLCSFAMYTYFMYQF